MSNQENISKETKKTRRKRSHRTAQQIKLAVIMIMVSVLVLSASTFAWYKMSKTANIQNMEFKADTLGNLLISADNTSYSNMLDLGLSGENAAILLPATTVDGKTFYQPEYNTTGDVVKNVALLKETDDPSTGSENEADTFKKFVYKKEFYIKSGVNQDTSKSYKLKLVDGGGILDGKFTTGTFLNDNGDDTTFDSLNALRVSFVIDGDVKIFTPYCNTNGGAGTHATDEIDKSSNQYGGYSVDLDQEASGVITDLELCTIKEGYPVKITMYVWFEGTDVDCENEIALDNLAGQIQFEAEE